MSSKHDERAKKGKALVDDELAREINKKEERLRRREREQHRTLYIAVGIAVGLTLLLIVAGVVYQLLVAPNRTVATVGDERIVARDFWKRTRLEQSQMLNAYSFYVNQEQQLGNPGFFTQQINQLSATLASPFAMGQQTLDNMIEERIIRNEAAARGITVSAEEIDAALREEVAGIVGAVAPPQATATAEAGATATAEATAWTPVPTPTLAATATVTATATAIPTPAPLPTPVVLTDTAYTEGLDILASTIRDATGMSLDDYRAVVEARLLREQLAVAVGESEVAVTEEQVRASHILIAEITPTPEPTPLPEGAPTPEPTATATPLPEGAPTPTPTPAPRTLDEAFALAQELRERILAGDDFAALAAQYSADQSNAQQGGDLGWFGRGRMAPPFEEAAFSLPVGEISEPISTTFGVHLIRVDERDAERPRDEATLEQERASAFNDWLTTQLQALPVERFDIEANLPRQLR